MYTLILHYLLHILIVKWLLMKLWQKPSRLFLCIINHCSLKTVLLHEASVGLHQITIRPLDLSVRTKWTMWICMSSFWHVMLYVFILTSIILYLFQFVIGRHWLEPSFFWLLLMNAALLTLPTCMGKSTRPLLVLLLNYLQSIFFLIVGFITCPRHCPLLMPVMFLTRSIEI